MHFIYYYYYSYRDAGYLQKKKRHSLPDPVKLGGTCTADKEVDTKQIPVLWDDDQRISGPNQTWNQKTKSESLSMRAGKCLLGQRVCIGPRGPDRLVCRRSMLGLVHRPLTRAHELFDVISNCATSDSPVDVTSNGTEYISLTGHCTCSI